MNMLLFLIITVFLFNAIISSRLNSWKLIYTEDNIKEEVTFENGFISYNFLPGTKWEYGRVQLNFGIYNTDDYYKVQRVIGNIENHYRVIINSTLFSVYFWGGDILELVNKNIENENTITYEIKIKSSEDSSKNVTIIYTLQDSDIKIDDEIIMDLINHKDSKSLSFLS
jgi:hypothetical protein